MLKKYGISIALSCLIGAASVYASANPAQEEFDSAVATYNKNDFAGAYKKFNDLYELKSDDPVVNFYLGRCATELKLYDQALLAFERVLTVDPTHVRSRVEMARVYMEEGSYDSAEVELNNALEYKLPDNVKAQVTALLKSINDSRKKNHLSGAFIGGFGLDTNVRNAPDFVPTVLTATTPGAKFDYSINETAVVNHTYDISKNLKWQNNVIVYGQQFRQAIDANILYMSLGSGLQYIAPSYTIAITPTVESLKYGQATDANGQSGVDALGGLLGKLTTMDRMQDMMKGVGINEKFNTNITQTVSLEQVLGVKKQFFNSSAAAGMSADVLNASLGLKKDLGDSRNIGATVLWSKNMALQEYSVRNKITNYYTKGVGLNYSTPVKSYFDLSLNTMLVKQDYQDNTRADLQKSFGFSLSRPIGKDMLLGASFNRIWNGSTADDLTVIPPIQMPYQKTTFGVSLTKAF